MRYCETERAEEAGSMAVCTYCMDASSRLQQAGWTDTAAWSASEAADTMGNVAWDHKECKGRRTLFAHGCTGLSAFL